MQSQLFFEGNETGLLQGKIISNLALGKFNLQTETVFFVNKVIIILATLQLFQLSNYKKRNLFSF